MLPGELFILSAPSGAGKTTLIEKALAGPLASVGDLVFAVSHTTRPPRRGEVDGQHYHFVDLEVFERMVEEGRFLEWAKVHARHYGTSLDEVVPRLEAGTDVLLDIDVQGAEQVLDLLDDAERAPFVARRHAIFLMPPSYRALADRLSRRALDAPEQIALRLEVSHWEVSRVERYDYVIVNHDADRASEALASVLLEKRYRRERMTDQVGAVLADFARARGTAPPPSPPDSRED